jgi:two-component system LytT family sensor kinase
MKTRGLTDFYLPSKVAYHVKILLASILIAVFFNTLWAADPFNDNFWYMIGSLFIQLEIFMFLAFRIFAPGSIKHGKTYKKQMISKLIKFYLIVFLIAAGFLFTSLIIATFLSEQTMTDVWNQFIQFEISNFLISWFIGIALGSLVFFYKEWNESLKREQKLREEKLIFQYETLKNQVNPHFLFNSLNTLSSLVSKDAKLAEKFISRFSMIYRYILENSNVELVKLSNEIAFVNDFFFLQKIRDNGKVELNLDIPNIEMYEILPISLQLLIENALKHNAATRDEPLKIKVFIEEGYLVVENKMQAKMQMEVSSKIGLKNLGERVKLVMNKEVSVESEYGLFVVKMPLKSV